MEALQTISTLKAQFSHEKNSVAIAQLRQFLRRVSLDFSCDFFIHLRCSSISQNLKIME